MLRMVGVLLTYLLAELMDLSPDSQYFRLLVSVKQ